MDMMIAAAISFFVAVLAWDLATDYKKWLKNRTVKHKKEWWCRAIALQPCVLFLVEDHIGIAWSFVFIVLLAEILIALLWWLLFDGIYNKLRGFGWWFNGSPEAVDDRSRFDKFLYRLPDWLEALVKLGPLLITIYLFIKFT